MSFSWPYSKDCYILYRKNKSTILSYIQRTYPHTIMKFDIRAGSTDICTSKHLFIGDEQINSVMYKRVIYNGYMSSVSTLYGAARGFGMDLDSQTFERWKRLGATAGIIDDLLDNAPDLCGALSVYEQSLERTATGNLFTEPLYTSSELVIAAKLLYNSVAILPRETQEALYANARTIGELALQKAGCNTIESYIDLLGEEATRTSELVTLASSLEVREQPQFKRFREWCEQAVLFATLADHTRDFRNDYKHRRTLVRPSLSNVTLLGFEAVQALRRINAQPAYRSATISAIRHRMIFSKRSTTSTYSDIHVNE